MNSFVASFDFEERYVITRTLRQTTEGQRRIWLAVTYGLIIGKDNTARIGTPLTVAEAAVQCGYTPKSARTMFAAARKVAEAERSMLFSFGPDDHWLEEDLDRRMEEWEEWEVQARDRIEEVYRSRHSVPKRRTVKRTKE